MTSIGSMVSAQEESSEFWKVFKDSSDRIGAVQKSTVNFPLKVSWTYTVDGKTNGFVDWGPVAADGIVYTSDGLNRVIALNSQSGEVMWKRDLVSNVFSVSLSKDAKILYVTVAITTKPSPTLIALDAKSGETLWDNMINDQPAVGGMEGAPVILDGKIYAGYLQYQGKGGIAAFDGVTGKSIWQVEVERMSPYTPLSYADGKLFVGFENKSINCLDAESGRLLWSRELKDLPYAAPTIYKRILYVGAGTVFYAIDTNQGQIMWTKTLEGEVGHSSASVHDDILYVGTRESKVFALKTVNGDIVWKKELQKGPIESSPLLQPQDELLYIATQGNWLLALDLESGEVKSELRLSEDERGVWKSAPAFYQGRLYVGSLDRKFYAVE